MPSRNQPLAALYTRFLNRQSPDWHKQSAAVCRQRQQKLERLHKRGVTTVGELLAELPTLPIDLKQFGIELASLLKLNRVVPVLLELMEDPKLRCHCASAMQLLRPTPKHLRRLIAIGWRELESSPPDYSWLAAAVVALALTDHKDVTALLVHIFERKDLPGWLRGDAADKLGYCPLVCDRRTTYFRRCRQTALDGLEETSIEMQFWSMYLLGTLCCFREEDPMSNRRHFHAALPRLRAIAATDHRLAPGYWWPMSAEAEDVIGCIEQGAWPDPDAAERWTGNPERGVMETRSG